MMNLKQAYARIDEEFNKDTSTKEFEITCKAISKDFRESCEAEIKRHELQLKAEEMNAFKSMLPRLKSFRDEALEMGVPLCELTKIDNLIKELEV